MTASFVHRNYTERTPGCVTNMVQSLGWESLQHRHLPSNYQWLESTTYHCYSRTLGKTTQVCAHRSCNPTWLTPHVHNFKWGSGAFYRASQFLYRVSYNLRRLLPLQWQKKKCRLMRRAKWPITLCYLRYAVHQWVPPRKYQRYTMVNCQ